MSTHTPAGDPATQDAELLVQALRRPQAYADHDGEVGFLQTHISLIFFAGERVYKVKKSVDLGFLDFTTLERRKRFCDEEVRLNRRLAPDVYLGVVPITAGPGAELRVGGAGEAVEWAVEMVRLPEARMFSNLLDEGEIDNQQMNSIVSLLAEFHATCATGAGVDEHGSPAAISANAEENFEQLLGFVRAPADSSTPPRPECLGVLTPRQHTFLRDQSRTWISSRRELLERRVSEQRIRDGHGDLHAGNLCFTGEGVVAFDCIEFSSRFRCGDVASDLAFLSMDLDYRGFRGFSGYLVKRYTAASGDQELPELIGFYKGYRAIVRAKVAALTGRSAALQSERREQSRLEAMRYIQLAVGYGLPATMVLMCGLPACGKSWVAGGLAGPLRATLLHSDVRRKTLAGLQPTTHVREQYGSGLYSSAMKERTYAALLDDAAGHLRAGRSVIVDATFPTRAQRAPFLAAAQEVGAPCFVVHVTAPEPIVRERMALRGQDPTRTSDAYLDVYLRARSTFEPPESSPEVPVVEIASGAGPLEEQSSQVLDAMIARAHPSPT